MLARACVDREEIDYEEDPEYEKPSRRSSKSKKDDDYVAPKKKETKAKESGRGKRRP